MGLFGPPNIDKMKAKGDVKGLIKALEYKKGTDPIILRSAAANALGELRDIRAIDPLITALRDENEYFRRDVVGALGLLSDSRVVNPLIAALNDNDSEVRNIAAKSLGQIGAIEATPYLSKMLMDKVDIRATVVETLDKLNWKPTNDVWGVEYWIVKGHPEMILKMGDWIVSPLINILNAISEQIA